MTSLSFGVDAAEVLEDLDTPADYARLENRFSTGKGSRGSVPGPSPARLLVGLNRAETMEEVLQEVVAMRRLGGRGALASLVESSGSIPMSERAKMLVREDGSVAGTIGGGCLEAEILNVGREVLSTGCAHTTRYTMTEKPGRGERA